MSYQDIKLGRTSEFTDGEMKQVSVEGKEILLARVNGNFYAVGATCTHYGAPLVEGVLNGERLVFDVGLLYVRYAASWNEIIFQGSLTARDFLAFYLKDDQVLAVAGMNRDREMAAIEELMRADRMPSRTQLKDGFPDLLELLKAAGLSISRQL